jgi:hypothetical protein
MLCWGPAGATRVRVASVCLRAAFTVTGGCQSCKYALAASAHSLSWGLCTGCPIRRAGLAVPAVTGLQVSRGQRGCLNLLLCPPSSKVSDPSRLEY